MGVCVCVILFRVVHCVGAFSDNYRRDLLKYRIGLIRGRLLGGPKERRRRYLPRLKRAWSRFVAFTWKIQALHTISLGREQLLVQLQVHFLVQLLVQFLEQPLVHLVVQVLVELLVQLLIPLLI